MKVRQTTSWSVFFTGIISLLLLLSACSNNTGSANGETANPSPNATGQKA
ncbi:hypothetical protein WG8_5181, partial [Paenibacillus sp. Aloe-11]